MAAHLDVARLLDEITLVPGDGPFPRRLLDGEHDLSQEGLARAVVRIRLLGVQAPPIAGLAVLLKVDLPDLLIGLGRNDIRRRRRGPMSLDDEDTDDDRHEEDDSEENAGGGLLHMQVRYHASIEPPTEANTKGRGLKPKSSAAKPSVRGAAFQ